jgi:hypothetical protein
VGPADDSLDPFALAFRAGQFYLFIRIHKKLFKDMAAFHTPKFKDWHCFAPGLWSMISSKIIAAKGIKVKSAEAGARNPARPLFCLLIPLPGLLYGSLQIPSKISTP